MDDDVRKFGINKKEQQFFNRVWIKNQTKARTCYLEGCNEPTAGNHVLSECYLKNICNENNEVYIYDVSFFNTGKVERVPSKYSRVRIGNDIKFRPISMRMLCSKHDSEIFKLIEQPSVLDVSDRKAHALFALKRALHEYAILQGTLDAYDEIICDENFSSVYEKRNLNRSHLRALINKSYIEEAIRALLKPDTDSLIFEAFKVAKKDLYLTTHRFKAEGSSFVMNFITFAPCKDFSVFSLAGFTGLKKDSSFVQEAISFLSGSGIREYKKNPLLLSYEIFSSNNPGRTFEGSEDDCLKLISDTTFHSDTYAYSCNFYEEYIAPRKFDILELKYAQSKSLRDNNLLLNISDFNIFTKP